MLATTIPYWSEIERMTLRRAPLPAFAPQSEAARIYAALWAEMEQRMAGKSADPPSALAAAWRPAGAPPRAARL